MGHPGIYQDVRLLVQLSQVAISCEEAPRDSTLGTETLHEVPQCPASLTDTPQGKKPTEGEARRGAHGTCWSRSRSALTPPAAQQALSLAGPHTAAPGTGAQAWASRPPIRAHSRPSSMPTSAPGGLLPRPSLDGGSVNGRRGEQSWSHAHSTSAGPGTGQRFNDLPPRGRLQPGGAPRPPQMRRPGHRAQAEQCQVHCCFSQQEGQ